MTEKVHKILILDGVEDYLTDLAKKYKRNLMLVGFLLVSIFLINKQGIDIELTSAFGFTFKSSSENGKIGIGLEFLALLLSAICLYEMLMLFIYKRQCDSHYFGKQLSKTNKDGEQESLDYLKREFTIISQEKNIAQESKELIEKYLETVKARNSAANKLVSPSEFERESREVIDRVISAHHDNNIQRVANFVSVIEHHLKLRNIRALSQLNEVQERYFYDSIHDAIKKEQLVTKTSHEVIKNEFFDKYSRLYYQEDKLISANEEWKIYIETQIQTSINVHNRLLEQLESFSTPRKLIVFMEVYLPLMWGFFSIGLGLNVMFQ